MRRADWKSGSSRRLLAVAVLVIASLIVTVASICVVNTRLGSAKHDAPLEPPVPGITDGEIARLPEATYDAVVPRLMTSTFSFAQAHSVERYELRRTAPLFDATRRHAIAKLGRTDFLQEPQFVVVARKQGPWAYALTPARAVLPSSTAPVAAPAQTAAWIPTRFLFRERVITSRVTIQVGRGQLTVVPQSGPETKFTAAVGAPDTPTPIGVVGYLEARYLDPAQGQATYPIHLTSLHAERADEPFNGTDGGLIGIHFAPTNTGTISHGCIRVGARAVSALSRLPLGTPIEVKE